jgi:ABC-type antimicrobial peptide transport system permease subunit
MPDGANLTLEQVELVMKGIDPRLGEIQIDSMQQRWDSSTEATRLNMYVVMSLATLTLVLAAIGVSGLSQMSASQKRYELAVRMATGAKQSRLLQLLLKDSLLMLVFGLGLGVLAAIGAYQYLQAFFDTAPVFDWSVTTAINIILAVVMLLSIAIPGWLVIRKDPMRVLREL